MNILCININVSIECYPSYLTHVGRPLKKYDLTLTMALFLMLKHSSKPYCVYCALSLTKLFKKKVYKAAIPCLVLFGEKYGNRHGPITEKQTST